MANDAKENPMNGKTIVLPTDFSTLSDAALEYATAQAVRSHARLLIVHVEEPRSMYGVGEMYYGVPDPDDTALKNMLAELRPSDPTVRYEHVLVKGSPAAEIVRLADESGAEMIVMGTHGRTGLERFLMGSVAEAVVRWANCPVLTVKSRQLIPQPAFE
jgi:nucleotide-binding universal stress UspA family protein